MYSWDSKEQGMEFDPFPGGFYVQFFIVEFYLSKSYFF